MKTPLKQGRIPRPGFPVPAELRILLVEDRPRDGERITQVLEQEGLWDLVDCYHVWDAEHALELLESHTPDLVISDRYLGETTVGSRRISDAVGTHRSRPRLLLTSASSEFLEPASFDAFIPKNARRFDSILAGEVARLLSLEPPAVTVAKPRAGAFATILGSSSSLVEVIDIAGRYATQALSVLLLGETGTGKELFARAIHAASDRSEGPFHPVDCGAIPEALIESELFGVKRGSFTGASEDRIGAFQAAHGGTLFLDEIGNLSLSSQATLLRALEQREVRPVGENASTPVDVRLIAATNDELESKVEAGRFRADLYYRIEVGKLTLPPLRERREDIPVLVEAFVDSIAEELRIRRPAIDPGAHEELRRRRWNGNVRELYNTLRASLALHRGEVLKSSDLKPEVVRSGSPARSSALDEVLDEFRALGAGSPPQPAALGLHGLLVLENGVRRLRAAGSGVLNAGARLSEAYGGKRAESSFNAFVSVHGNRARRSVRLALAEGLSLANAASEILGKPYGDFSKQDEELSKALADCRRSGSLDALQRLYPFVPWGE